MRRQKRITTEKEFEIQSLIQEESKEGKVVKRYKQEDTVIIQKEKKERWRQRKGEKQTHTDRGKERREKTKADCFRGSFFFWTLFDDDEMTNKQKWKGRTGAATTHRLTNGSTTYGLRVKIVAMLKGPIGSECKQKRFTWPEYKYF